MPLNDDRKSAHAPAARFAAAALWLGATGALAVWLLQLGSFQDAYGSVWTGAALLVWITLFSVLYHATPKLRARSRPHPAVEPPPQDGVAVARIVDRVDRVVTPSAALRNTAAQAQMMSILGADAAGMTEQEADMMDWGFAFGVAWAVARSQDPLVSEDVVSRRALHATQAVYLAYRGASTPAASAAQAHAHRA